MTDKLTDHGILTDSPAVSLVDYHDMRGAPVFENGDVVIFSDGDGGELSEWARELDMDRDDLAKRMHELARRYYHTERAGDPWGVNDPVVFDARSFDMEDWILYLAYRRLSPAEALDYYMVEKRDHTQSFWAGRRGIDQSTVSENVSKAKKKLSRSEKTNNSEAK